MHELNIRTRTVTDFYEITSDIQDIVISTGIMNGVCHIFVLHTTAAVTVNEHADPSVVEDIINRLDALVPLHSSYRHSEGNAPAHIKASLIGNSQAVFIENGKLVLGTWQGIFLCEFDGPRNRTVLIKVLPG
jgi:secondary thiamine-phosphate synthase enzyme